jgi:hypothetical protein
MTIPQAIIYDLCVWSQDQECLKQRKNGVRMPVNSLRSTLKSLHSSSQSAVWRKFVEEVLPFYYSSVRNSEGWNSEISWEGGKMARKNDDLSELKMRTMCIGLAIGMPIGIALSLLFLFVMDTPGLIGAGAAVGISLSIAIGEGLYQRKKDHEGASR